MGNVQRNSPGSVAWGRRWLLGMGLCRQWRPYHRKRETLCYRRAKPLAGRLTQSRNGLENRYSAVLEPNPSSRQRASPLADIAGLACRTRTYNQWDRSPLRYPIALTPVTGAVTRNQTLDILITKQALYLLSYDGVYFSAFAMFCIGVDTGYDPVASTEPGTVRANP